MFTENERFHILDLLDKIMISMSEIPWESITLSVFKNWYDLLIFENMLCRIIMVDSPSINLMNIVTSVDIKVYRFFFKSLIDFQKMNIKIVDANIIAQNSENSFVHFKETKLMHIIERIKHCETIQDLIDGSPTPECPVCMDVTFTESTAFQFRLNCNHLVCHSCAHILADYNYRLVKKHFIFLSLD